MDLAVYMKEPAVRVLGPGVRYALWVQGCPRRCPGCVAENAWDPDGGAVSYTHLTLPTNSLV